MENWLGKGWSEIRANTLKRFLARCNTLEESIDIIIEYAVGSRNEQFEYLNIAPYGGEGLSEVPSVQEIAFGEIGFLKEKYPEAERIDCVLGEALIEKGYKLELYDEQIKTYKAIKSEISRLEREWPEYEVAIEKINRYQNDISELQNMQIKPAMKQYDLCQKEIKRIEEFSPIKRYFNKGKYEELQTKASQLKDSINSLTQKIGDYTAKIDEISRKAGIEGPKYNAAIYIYHPWDCDYENIVTTRRELQKEIRVLEDYIKQPNVEKAYKNAVEFMETLKERQSQHKEIMENHEVKRTNKANKSR